MGTGATPPRGRYAPSPTGLIHVGNARTALAAWLSVRSRGGTFVWRLEDLDLPRVVPGMAALQMEDLEHLAAASRLFPCRRSRKDLQSLASAPHGPEGGAPYPAGFRPQHLDPV